MKEYEGNQDDTRSFRKRKLSKAWKSTAIEEHLKVIDDLDKINFTDMKVV